MKLSGIRRIITFITIIIMLLGIVYFFSSLKDVFINHAKYTIKHDIQDKISKIENFSNTEEIPDIQSLIKTEIYGHPVTSVLCDENFQIIASTDNKMAPGMNFHEYSEDSIVAAIIAHDEIKDTEPFDYLPNRKQGICGVSAVNGTNWKIIMIVLPVDLDNCMVDINTKLYLGIGFIIVILLVYFAINLHLHLKGSKQIEALQMTVINSLTVIYENLFSVNIKTGEIHTYRMSTQIQAKYGSLFSSENFTDAVSQYKEDEVLEEDWHLLEKIENLDAIAEIFEKTAEHSFIYRIHRDDEIHYFQCSLLNPEEGDYFVVGFKDIDELMEKQIENQKRLSDMIDMQSTQISIMTSISEIYLTSHLIDLNKDMVAEINTTKNIRSVVNNIDHAREQITAAMKKFVVPEDLEDMLVFTNLDTIQKRLKGKKIISKEFVGISQGWIRGSFILVENDENNVPAKVLFVTQVIDDEKQQFAKLRNQANRDELTALLNRNAYEDTLRSLKSNPPSDDLVYISFDVNGLKVANDTLGHSAGDELLMGCAVCLSKVFSPYGKVYRTGGDEFQAIIYASPEKLEELKKEFDNIVLEWSGKLVEELKVSAGYVHKSEMPDSSISEIVKLADTRMYKAKSEYYSERGIDRRGQQVAFEVLCHSYTKILKVDLLADKFTVIQMNPEEKDSLKGYDESIFKWLHDFAVSGQVHKDDVDEYLKATDKDFLINYFAEGNSCLDIHYRRKINDSFKMVIMEMMPSKDYSPENQIIFLYVKNIEKK